MGEERLRVLEMVAAGKLTPEQAGQLLDAMGEPAPRPTPRPAERPERRGLPARLNADQLVMLHDHGVDADFLRAVRKLDFPITIDEVVMLYDHGVDPDFIKSMKKLNLDDLSVDMICRLYDHGVDAEFVREMRHMQDETFGDDR